MATGASVPQTGNSKKLNLGPLGATPYRSHFRAAMARVRQRPSADPSASRSNPTRAIQQTRPSLHSNRTTP